MAWTSPRTWAPLEFLTAAIFNTHVRDNLNYLHDRLQIGTITITPSAANTPTSATFTFPTGFPTAPIAIASLASGVPGVTVTGVAADTETTTNCRVTITRTNTTPTTVRVMAFLP